MAMRSLCTILHSQSKAVQQQRPSRDKNKLICKIQKNYRTTTMKKQLKIYILGYFQSQITISCLEIASFTFQCLPCMVHSHGTMLHTKVIYTYIPVFSVHFPIPYSIQNFARGQLEQFMTLISQKCLCEIPRSQIHSFESRVRVYLCPMEQLFVSIMCEHLKYSLTKIVCPNYHYLSSVT